MSALVYIHHTENLIDLPCITRGQLEGFCADTAYVRQHRSLTMPMPLILLEPATTLSSVHSDWSNANYRMHCSAMKTKDLQQTAHDAIARNSDALQAAPGLYRLEMVLRGMLECACTDDGKRCVSIAIIVADARPEEERAAALISVARD